MAFEAGACHTPFVSTPVGILAEVARNGVHGFFAKKPHAIAERMIEMIQDPGLRERLGENFRRLILKSFEWHKTVKYYAESYLRLLKAGG